MIDIKELSVGNWVYNKHHGKAIQITPFDFFTHTHIDGMQYLIENPNLVSGKDFEPIPITPEILEKNGFIWDAKIQLYVWKYDGYYVSCDLHGKTRIYVGNDYILGLPLYVHQLQNALTLCGINKEIEL